MGNGLEARSEAGWGGKKVVKNAIMAKGRKRDEKKPHRAGRTFGESRGIGEGAESTRKKGSQCQTVGGDRGLGA